MSLADLCALSGPWEWEIYFLRSPSQDHSVILVSKDLTHKGRLDTASYNLVPCPTGSWFPSSQLPWGILWANHRIPHNFLELGSILLQLFDQLLATQQESAGTGDSVVVRRDFQDSGSAALLALLVQQVSEKLTSDLELSGPFCYRSQDNTSALTFLDRGGTNQWYFTRYVCPQCCLAHQLVIPLLTRQLS